MTSTDGAPFVTTLLRRGRFWAILLVLALPGAAAVAQEKPASQSAEQKAVQPADPVKAPKAPPYTVAMIAQHTEKVRQSPFVTPTASANGKLVIGKSAGWEKEPQIPPHDLYGYQITDPKTAGKKIRVVMASGNHNTEHTGSWALQGAVDFLLSDDPRAATLRKSAVFCVYPMVNPDGRFLKKGRSNPEMAAKGITDHNRVWHTSGEFSTIDQLKAAMKKDTGGRTDFLLDFHSTGDTHFRTGKELMASAFVQMMAKQQLRVKAQESRGHPGMLRNWSMGADGLDATYAYTPEHAHALSAEQAQAIGRTYMLALHDLLTEMKSAVPGKQKAAGSESCRHPGTPNALTNSDYLLAWTLGAW